MPGPYRISAYEFEALALATHQPPLGAYRGVGMTMGAFVAERMLDLVAERLSLDQPRSGGATSSRARLIVYVGRRLHVRQR
jgi:hypothetical protein